MSEKTKIDKELKIISAKSPEEFQILVNDLLAQCCWRVVQTEMSVSDNHYFAMLIKNESVECYK